MKLREKTFILFIALVYLIGQVGCATGRYEYPKPEPLSETYRAQLGTIGVVSEPVVPILQFDKPLPLPQPGVLVRMGQGTVEGAGKSWNWWLDLCSLPWDHSNVENRQVGPAIGQLALYSLPFVLTGVCYILTPPVTIFGGLGGFFYGAIPSSPEYPAYVEETEVLIRDTMAKYPIQEKFQISFLKEAGARTSHTFVVISEEGRQTAEKGVAQGVDTVLELSVEKIWLKRLDDGEGEWNPSMVLVLVVRAKLVQGTEKTEWYDQIFVHEKKRLYDSWFQRYYYSSRFGADIEEAYQNLAEQMVEKLFLPNPTSSPAKIDTSAFSTETPLISQKKRPRTHFQQKGKE